MDISSDTLTRLGTKLDACDLTDDEHTALVELLTHHPAGGAGDEVSGFATKVKDSHDKYANLETNYVQSISFAQLLPTLMR